MVPWMGGGTLWGRSFTVSPRCRTTWLVGVSGRGRGRPVGWGDWEVRRFTSPSTSPPGTGRFANARINKKLERLEAAVTRGDEEELSLAYAQAIRYVARSGEARSVASAESLLNDAISRVVHEIGSGSGTVRTPHGSTRVPTDRGSDADTPDRVSDRLVELLRTHSKKGKNPETTTTLTKTASLLLPPDRTTFHHVLHALASSKLRKKGLKADAWIVKMAKLSILHSEVFHDVFPDTKAFSLAIKCHAESTYTHAFERITDLHHAHDRCLSSPFASFLNPDDPHLLMLSIKALSFYETPMEEALVLSWLERLHSSLLSKLEETHDELALVPTKQGPLGNDATAPMDVTGTYHSVIRTLVRSQNDNRNSHHGVPQKAQNVLGMMHELASAIENYPRPGTTPPVSIRVQASSYEWVLGAYARLESGKLCAVSALGLLQEMFRGHNDNDNDNDQNNDYSSLRPPPTERSFEYCLQALGRHPDPAWIEQTSRSLLDEYEKAFGLVGSNPNTSDGEKKTASSSSSSTPTSTSGTARVYNSFLQLYLNRLSGHTLLDDVTAIVSRMKDTANVEPDGDTLSMLLRACSMAKDHQKAEAWALAQKTYERTRLCGDGETLPPLYTESCAHHMMLCIQNLAPESVVVQDTHTSTTTSTTTPTTNPTETTHPTLTSTHQEALVQHVFHDCCRWGTVNRDVLDFLRRFLPAPLFVQLVGEGRLADGWIANVQRKKVLYTDGSRGGPNKHARRKGKSTSNWVQKQRRRDQEIEANQQAKREKRKLQKEAARTRKERTTPA